MGWEWKEEVNAVGAQLAYFNGPVKGVDTDAGDTQVRPQHVVYSENMRLQSGRMIGVNGYSLLDTAMDADDNGNAAGFGQYLSGSTATYMIVEANGDVQTWSGSAWVQRLTGATTTNQWNELNYLGYLFWANVDDGNWFWDGSNFMPVGAVNISDCESDQDSLWANETAETTVVKEGSQSYSTGALGSGGSVTLTYTPASAADYTTAKNLATAYTESNAAIEFYIYVTDASEVDEAASFFRITTTNDSAYRQEDMDEWIDKNTGAVVVLADNTWFHITIPITDMAETGAFNLASVADIDFYIEEDGGSGFTGYIDGVMINYTAASQMPGVESLAVWNDVMFGIGATTSWTSGGTEDSSNVHFTPVGAPHEYDATAFIAVNPDAGGAGVAVKRFFNQIFVGKNESCHSIGGTTAGTVYPNFNFEVLDITDEHGVDGHRSIVEWGRKLYFPHKNRWMVYDGTGTDEFHVRISPDLQDHEETRTQQKVSVLYPRESEIWLAYPGNGDTHNTRLAKYMPVTDSFLGVQDGSTALNLNHLKIVLDSSFEKIVGVDEAGDVMWLDDTASTTFDGTAITRTVRFPWLGKGEEWFLWTELTAFYDTQSSGTVSVQYRVADTPRAMSGASFVTADTVALSSQENYGRVFIGERGRWIQFQFTSSAAFFDVQMPVVAQAVLLGR